MTKEQKLQVFELLLDGGTYQQAADLVGCSRQIIHQMFRNVSGFKNGRPAKAKYGRFCKVYSMMQEKNITYSEMAELIGLSYNGFTSKMKEKTEFTLTEFEKLVKALGCKFEDVLSDGDSHE